MRRSVLLSVTAAATATPAFAGSADPSIWVQWFGDPVVEGLLGLLLAVYLMGLAEMLSREHQKWPVGKMRVAAFVGAVAVIGVALLSPIDALSDELFSVHMLQHLLLILGAAPLLAFSNAHLVMLRAFPVAGRRSLGRAVASIPGVRQAAHKHATAWIAAACFVCTMWFWHIPAAYDWALDNEAVHVGEHLTLLAAATFFWRVIITSGDRRLSPAMAVILVSLVGIQGALLSALITFAPHSLYGAYAGNPLDDQVLAGVLMCIPASFVYLGSTIWALWRMLGNSRTRMFDREA
jgi:cytochrome c oxidase assembly factor CtaG